MTRLQCIFICVLLFLNIHSVQNSISIDFLLRDGCQDLSFHLCQRNDSKLSSLGLLTSLRCLQAKNPECSPINAPKIKSLTNFKDYFCSEPEKACEFFVEKLKCDRPSDPEGSCIETFTQCNIGSDLQEMSEDFASFKCINESPKRDCLKEFKDLAALTNEKSFAEWYFNEADLDKFQETMAFCLISTKLPCPERRRPLLAICSLGDEREKGILKQRWARRKFGDPQKQLATYCSGSVEEKSQLGPLPSDFNFQEAAFRYDLCDLQDPNTIEFAYSLALCYLKSESMEKGSCFSRITGGLPSEKSNFVQWFCRTDFEIGNGTTGDINLVAKECGEVDVLARAGSCDDLVTEKHFLCQPKEKWAKRIQLCDAARWKLTAKDFPNHLKCLAILNESLVNECYSKAGKFSSQVNAFKGEKLEEAICSSKEPFNTLEHDINQCLVSRKYPEEYIDGCQLPFSSLRYGEELNCTFPIFGKPAEECVTKFTNEPLFSSESEFSKWERRTNDFPDRLKLMQACLRKVRSSNEKLNKQQIECARTLIAKIEFQEQKREICLNKDKDVSQISSSFFKCDISHGNFSQSEECRQKISSLKDIDDAAKYEKWLCSCEEEEFLKVKKCIQFSEKKEDLVRFESCLDAVTG